jgi:hypothetical protein
MKEIKVFGEVVGYEATSHEISELAKVIGYGTPIENHMYGLLKTVIEQQHFIKKLESLTDESLRESLKKQAYANERMRQQMEILKMAIDPSAIQNALKSFDDCLSILNGGV